MTQRLVATILLTAIGTVAIAKTPVATGTGGAVATISEQASRSALAILDRGGNAIDAAVAAAATLGVTDPFSCGIGGGGFMVVYLAREKRVVTIDHRETAPAAFTPAVFLDNGKEMDFDSVVASGQSVGVPGTVRGWDEALRRYGTMSLKQVLAPAIDVAGKGFTVDANFSRLVEENTDKFRRFPATAALYLKDGKALPPGTLLKNPDLARTYRTLAQGGVKAFYEGPLARGLVLTYDSYSDSRCPANARCVWAGRLIFRFLIDGPAGVEEFTLGPDQPTATPAALHGARITLDTSAIPPARTAGTLRPSDIIPVTLKISAK
jgi:gamma-glutamyltranspeptidase/glutathione hydrolase